MARRLHSSTLGGSRKWAALQTDSARMLYERMIDDTDPFGNIDADPIMVKANCIPRLMTTVEDVAAYLDDMEAVGLIERWEVDGNPYAHIVDFEQWNNPDPTREAQTRIPLPGGTVPQRPDRKRTDKKQAKVATKTRAKPEQVEPSAGPDRAEDLPRSGVGHDQVTTRSGGGPELVQPDVEGEGDVEKVVLTSPTTQGLSPPTYAASPRSLAKSNGSAKPELTKAKSGTHPQHEALLAVWNEHRGALAGHRVVDDHRAKGFTDLIRKHGFEEAQNLLRDAALYVREYDVYLDGNHGLNALLRQGRLVSYAELTRQGMKPKPRGDPAVDRHVAAADRADGLAAHIQRTRGVQP